MSKAKMPNRRALLYRKYKELGHTELKWPRCTMKQLEEAIKEYWLNYTGLVDVYVTDLFEDHNEQIISINPIWYCTYHQTELHLINGDEARYIESEMKLCETNMIWVTIPYSAFKSSGLIGNVLARPSRKHQMDFLDRTDYFCMFIYEHYDIVSKIRWILNRHSLSMGDLTTDIHTLGVYTGSCQSIFEILEHAGCNIINITGLNRTHVLSDDKFDGLNDYIKSKDFVGKYGTISHFYDGFECCKIPGATRTILVFTDSVTTYYSEVFGEINDEHHTGYSVTMELHQKWYKASLDVWASQKIIHNDLKHGCLQHVIGLESPDYPQVVAGHPMCNFILYNPETQTVMKIERIKNSCYKKKYGKGYILLTKQPSGKYHAERVNNSIQDLVEQLEPLSVPLGVSNEIYVDCQGLEDHIVELDDTLRDIFFSGRKCSDKCNYLYIRDIQLAKDLKMEAPREKIRKYKLGKLIPADLDIDQLLSEKTISKEHLCQLKSAAEKVRTTNYNEYIRKCGHDYFEIVPTPSGLDYHDVKPLVTRSNDILPIDQTSPKSKKKPNPITDLTLIVFDWYEKSLHTLFEVHLKSLGHDVKSEIAVSSKCQRADLLVNNKLLIELKSLKTEYYGKENITKKRLVALAQCYKYAEVIKPEYLAMTDGQSVLQIKKVNSYCPEIHNVTYSDFYKLQPKDLLNLNKVMELLLLYC